MTTLATIDTSLPRFLAWKAIRGPLGLMLAYYAGAKLAFLIGTLSDKIFAPFWPPNTILFCVLMVVPMRRWWIFVLACFPAHLVAELEVGMGAVQLLVAFVTNCLLAVISAWLLRIFVAGPPWFAALRSMYLYILVAAVFSPAVVALGGALVPILGDGNYANYWSSWWQWYAANALGALALGVPALIWASEGTRAYLAATNARLAEAAGLALLLVIVTYVVLEGITWSQAGSFLPALIYLPISLMAWAAIRFGTKGVSLSIFIVAIMLIWHFLSEVPVFVAQSAETAVLALQAFLISLSAPMLLLGASIDETREARQATQQGEERMAFAAVSASTGLWEHDIPTQRFWATDFCRDLFGIPDGTALTREAIIEATHPEDRAIAVEAMRTDLTVGDPGSEFRVELPNGTTRWILARTHVYRNTNGAPQRVGGILADITRRKQLELEAEQRRGDLVHLTRVSILGELSGAIAHELNQPLTAILSNAQATRLMLAKRVPDLDGAKEAIDDIIREDVRASNVISRLRGLLKKGEVKLEGVDINQLVRAALQILRSELIGQRIKLELDLAKNLPAVQGDPVQIEQVLLNLVMNAIEAMAAMPPPRRHLRITTALSPAGYVETVIADRGRGIALEHEDRLGEPFFTTKSHGLGLGLPICTTIVKSHGGKLSVVNSASEGVTATFTVPTETVRLSGGAK